MQSLHSAAYKDFLVQLRKARKASGLTQVEVADRLGIPGSRVSRMETGERRIDIIELAAFAKLYRKRLSYFVDLRSVD